MPPRLTHYVLAAALEGGSNYWLRDYSFRIQSKAGEGDQTYGDYAAVHIGAPREGAECDEPVKHSRIGAARIARGIELALTCGNLNLARCAANVLAGNHDANDADVVLQFAAFGEVIYG
jgi:hypothetical protein